MSMKNSGCLRRAGTSPAAIRSPAAAVDVSTTSTSPSFAATSSSPSAVAAEARREAGPCFGRAVGDVRDRGAAGGEVARRELADPARSDEHDLAPLQIAEDLRRERGRGRRHRGRALADRGLGAHELAELERLAKHPVEQRPGRGGVERRAHLAEDLALARDQRVEPGGDAEEVQRRRVVVHAVGDRAQRLAGELLERLERAGAVVAREVDLGAVAGREADGVAEPAGEGRGPLERQRDALAQLDRRDVMRDADEREGQKWLPARTTRATITRPKPTRASCAARRPVARVATKPA